MYANTYSPAAASQSYQSVDVSTASPARLIALLMEGLSARLALAAKLEKEGSPAADLAVNKSLSIISYLQNNLDMAQGGEIAGNLQNLYVYMGGRLRQRADRGAAIDEVHGLVAPLVDAWAQLSKGAESTATTSSMQMVA